MTNNIRTMPEYKKLQRMPLVLLIAFTAFLAVATTLEGAWLFLKMIPAWREAVLSGNEAAADSLQMGIRNAALYLAVCGGWITVIAVWHSYTLWCAKRLIAQINKPAE